MAIESLQALVTASENRDICDVIIESDCVDRGVTQAESLEKMRGLYAAIRRAQRGYDPKLRSASGMVGGDGEKMRAYVQRGKTICGDYIGGVIAQALEMGESNACMKCIVAAPTAGSCGVLPAVLLPYQQREGLSDEAMVRAMYVAGAIGQVVAAKASIAGAAGGCQAEIGTASAMGAAALCYLGGGDAQAVCHAAAIAIKAMLGLVCDPIAGLVEVPCVKRNAAGAVIAMSSADMALAGIRSAVPPDEVILAMREVGDKMDVSLKETGVGGVAGTPFGQKIADCERLPYYEHANEAYEENPLRDKYPLFGCSEHSKYHVHSQLAYTPVMRELEPEPLLKVNATDAAERGIQQGDYVRVYNDHGYAVLKARVTEGIKPGVVSIPHGFQASQFVEGHTQDLTNVYMNDFCSNSAFYDFLCEVEKYEGGVR